MLLQAATLPGPIEAGWEGEKVCVLLQENETMRAMRCIFAPGAGHERHFHAPHFGYIVEGAAMRITSADGTRDVETKTGASWQSDGVEWHEVLNTGDTTGVYVIVEPKHAHNIGTQE
jgi:quercetin dioxygenase-like cupin family protein